MKKEEPKKKIKNEKMTLEKLASLIEKLAVFTVNGFEEMRQGQVRLEHRQEKLEQGYTKLEQGQEGLREDVAYLKEEQKETNRCLRSLERKQVGTLTSLDETVHRNEFNKLAHRVEALEA